MRAEMTDHETDPSATASTPALSCGLPPNRDFARNAKLAEDIGYHRVWSYDSPALYGDVWAALARAAEVTDRIGLGTGVAVPSLRHVTVTASAIASIEDLAPGRLVAAFGTGFTARRAMGQPPMKWADLETYVQQLRALLRGETVIVDGGACQLIYSPGFGPERPIEVPLLMAPIGPKGFEASKRSADGVLLTGTPTEPLDPHWQICAELVGGTVLRPGETDTDARVRDAAGPLFVTSYHAVWEFGPELVDGMPGGADWRKRVESERDSRERHLAVHEGHLVTVTERDAPLLDEAGAGLLATGWTGSPAEIRAKMRAAAAAGITEIMYAPAGADVRGELRAFYAAGTASD
jgi:5,10-methylenetetrahydromethanopterin reductase